MFLGSSRYVCVDIPLSLEEASSKSASMVYDLCTIRKEGRGTKERGGGGMLVSFVVRFKLCIRLARF